MIGRRVGFHLSRPPEITCFYNYIRNIYDTAIEINANAIFGGIDIIVPPNVNVKVKSTPIFGGTSNKVKTTYNENLPTIYINSLAMFGGVEIK